MKKYNPYVTVVTVAVSVGLGLYFPKSNRIVYILTNIIVGFVNIFNIVRSIQAFKTTKKPKGGLLK